jgi:hypothetical protein
VLSFPYSFFFPFSVPLFLSFLPRKTSRLLMFRQRYEQRTSWKRNTDDVLLQSHEWFVTAMINKHTDMGALDSKPQLQTKRVTGSLSVSNISEYTLSKTSTRLRHT